MPPGYGQQPPPGFGYQPPAPPPPPKPRKPWWQTPPALIGGAALLLFIIAIGVTNDDDEQATPTPSASEQAPAPEQEPPAEQAPPPEDEDPTPAQLEAHLAQGAGRTTLAEACTDGVTWMCDIDHLEVKAGTLVVHAAAEPDPARLARSAFNFTCGDEPFGIDKVQAITDAGTETYPSAWSDPEPAALCSNPIT